MAVRLVIGSDIIGIASDYGFDPWGMPLEVTKGVFLYSFIKPRFNRILDCLQRDLDHIEISITRKIGDEFNEELFSTLQKEVESGGFVKEIKKLSNEWNNITDYEIETEAEAIISRRKGQEKYRQAQIELWNGRCALTGVDILSLLNGSHAKAWKYSNNTERLDPFNGFLFEARIDRLFDKYLISFKDDGSILISKSIDEKTRSVLGINESMKLSNIYSQNIPYLHFHRDKYLKVEEMYLAETID